VDKITPTGHGADRWNGTKTDPEQRFTDQQLATIRHRYPHRSNWDVREVKLKKPRERTRFEIGIPQSDIFDWITVPCPIVARGLEQDTVIAPAGDVVRLKSERKK
jgi:hypothetical protein